MATYHSVYRRRQISGTFWALLALLFIIWMVKDPQGVFTASQRGLQAWWNIVFPALLPFFIASDLLTSLGFVRFLGTLLQPIMRPIFNLPGDASFVMAIGFTSGYPIGSAITAQLRANRQVTRLEGERLMAFTNNASPLFMLCAVAIGMFHNPSLGILIASAHYLANLTIGIGLRFYGRNDPEATVPIQPPRGLFKHALREMFAYQRQNYQPLGGMLSEAVKKSVQQLLTIGGFIIIFSVIINIMNQLGGLDLLAKSFSLFTTPLGLHPDLNQALAAGFFEITLGVKRVSETTSPLWQQAIAISLILAWCGISVQAQVASMISKTDLRMKLFVFCRLLHAMLASAYCFLLSDRILTKTADLATTVMSWQISRNYSWWSQLKFYTVTSGLDIVLLVTIAVVIVLITGRRLSWSK